MTARGLAAVAFAAATTLMAGCTGGQKQAGEHPVPVVVATAMQKNIPFEVTSIGNVEAYRTVAVRSQVGGVLSHVYFQEGETVKKGDRLFLIDPAPFQAALDAAAAKLARDKATEANLEESNARYDELAKKNYITEQQHSDMVTQLETMKATVRADQADVEAARIDLQNCSIDAPIGGRMGSRLVDEGNVVKANGDNPMVVIHQMQPVFVRFSVPEKYLPRILRYAAAETLVVRAHAPSEEPGAHEGRLTFVDNAVDPSTGTIMLKAEFDNDDMMMWPGEFVNVVLVLHELSNAVVVPTQSIGTGQKGDYIFVVKPDGTADVRSVTVGYRRDNEAVIESGIDPGDKVVTDGQLRLRPGAKVVEKSRVTGGEASASGADST